MIAKNVHRICSACTVGGLANEWVSYALPADEYRKGGYEASMSFSGETLGQRRLQRQPRGWRHGNSVYYLGLTRI